MTKQHEYFLAIDQGTFSSRAVIYDDTGRVIESAQQSISLNRKDHQHVEQDAAEILQSVRQVVATVLNTSAITGQSIKSAGLATQRSSIVAWSPSSGEALSPILSWQDTRAADWLSKFKHKQKFIQNRSGLRLSPHYGVSKMMWLLNNNAAVINAKKNNDCVITPIASYLLFHLTHNNKINIDIANASRSQLCNFLKRNWDKKLIELFCMQESVLAQCCPVQYNYGTINETGINITAVNGDQTSALFSNGNPGDKVLRVNMGTGAFVLMPAIVDNIKSKEFENSGLLAGISNSTIEQASYYIEGTINGAGSALKWLQGQYSDKDFNKLLQQNFDNIHPAIFINSIGGFGSPIWRNDIPAYFVDEFDTVKAPEKALLAVIESIVFLININIERMRTIKIDIEKIVISGGLSNLNFLCQRLANLSSLKIDRYEDPEATARGIAWLAQVETKSWKKMPLEKTFYPKHDNALKYRYNKFKNHLAEVHDIVL